MLNVCVVGPEDPPEVRPRAEGAGEAVRAGEAEEGMMLWAPAWPSKLYLSAEIPLFISTSDNPHCCLAKQNKPSSAD